MFTPAQLTQEIEKVIERFEAEKSRALHPEWITQAVVDLHLSIEGADTDFWRLCGRAEIRNKVGARLNRYKIKPEVEADAQITLAGFERLQQRYQVTEDGEQVAIRIQDLTRAQRRAKWQELEAMGAGCYQHAEEMKRYDAMCNDSNESAA
jgi:hypothetical protein